ncbi:hypothetical protein Moror_4460 [Moniliophthora roreri MCA 2997]|uniref:DUF6534 domain-containing protein n=1 Tax=Moniliophthora roreri (strain MCA 2997) TaxID=1381753 RepID=V2XFL3_MONRO|nr:hypothetical protein Moror_4460 [Moniliophthora roreri MCA 2997]
MSSPTIDNTLGATLLGFALASVLSGILIHQMFVYFMTYQEDKRFYKLVVTVIFVLEFINQILIGHFCYHYTITNFSNPFAIWVSHDTWSIIQTIGATVGSIVTMCYAARVWRLSERNHWITGILICLTIAHFVCSLAFTVKAFGLGPIAEVYMIKRIGRASLAFGASSDIATAAALCYFLNKLRKNFQHNLSASRLVDNLVRYGVSTGATTSLVSISCLIMFNLMPQNLVFIGVYFALSKCYAISFMAMLNTRRLMNGRGMDHSSREHSEQVRSRNSYASTTMQVARDPESRSESPIWSITSKEPSGNTENISLEVINPSQTAKKYSFFRCHTLEPENESFF